MNLILFGFKNCGKTTLGKKLAKALKVGFIDTDDLIEKLNNSDCRTLYRTVGPDRFRLLELEAIQGLQSVAHSVIALGGGAILLQDNVDFLSKIGTLVYLEVDKEELKKRILSADPLPAYIDPEFPEDSFDRMYDERLPRYKRVEATCVRVSGKTEKDVLKELKKLYEK